ncbi:MAG: PD-(D/E)XK nuclease family protein [Candidatus Omnitrophota bacterium]
MGKVVTFSLTDNFIGKLADFLEETGPPALKLRRAGPAADLSRTAIVFGGKRPALYLKKELAQRFGKSFFPPVFFNVDEFMEYVVRRRENFQRISETEACYLIYNLNRQLQMASPAFAKVSAGKFSRFLPWAREIHSFIEQLDLEDVPPEALENVEKSAEIGYDIPEGINEQLGTIVSLRDAYHKVLEEEKKYSRGLVYRLASRYIDQTDLAEFDRIIFAGLFYLNRTEEKVIRFLYDNDKAVVVFQGSQKEWPVLERASRIFGCSVRPSFSADKPQYNLKLYAGFDAHSQAGLAREILKTIPPAEREKTVIVVPEPAGLLPLFSEIAGLAGNFNVSMGYPLKRSSIHSLFRSIFQAQETRHGSRYYTRDYLRVLSHPFIKNLELEYESSVTRVLVHRLEEFLLGVEENPLSGSLFIRLKEIESLEQVYLSVAEILGRMGLDVGVNDLKKILRELHHRLFLDWEEKRLNTFRAFSLVLEKFINLLLQKSFLARYPLNREFVQAVLAVKKEMATASFRDEKFSAAEIFRIFEDKLDNGLINFSGSPLKELQVLGIFETRNLSFQEVIVIDANESVLPRLRTGEPLIPREVMINLGLERHGLEEEIQRYQFRSLLASARNVHLIYARSPEKEKSRFIEELIWKNQQETASLDEPVLRKALFDVQPAPVKSAVGKNREMVNFLQNFRYSASSVDTYLQCPLMFYYRYVLGLQEKEELLEEPESKEIGTFIHALLEEAYQGFLGREPVIDETFRNFFLGRMEERFRAGFQKTIKAGGFLVRQLLRQRLEKFLDYERESRKVREIVSLEQGLEGRVEFSGRVFKFGYRVDRIDRLPDGRLLVIDYKTGAERKTPSVKKMESMELNRESIRESINSFQMPLYIFFIDREYKTTGTTAALYYLRDIGLTEFPGEESLAQKELIMEKCLQALEYILSEITDPAVGFGPDEESCRRCQFVDICR